VNNTRDASEAVSILTDAIGGMYINDCFPLIKVKVSSKDLPYMTPLVKHLCKMRNRQIRMGISPELQEKINILIRENQIRAVKAENRKFKRGSKEWWRTVNKITGRSINVDRVSSVIDPGRMKKKKKKINTDTHYTTPVLLLINPRRYPYPNCRRK
jgi:hypothetical protein